MVRPLPRLTFAAAVAAALAVAGCGGGSSGSSGSPKSELTTGITNLSHSDVLTTTLKLDTTAAALQAFAQASHQSLGPGDAQALAGANLVIEAKTANGQNLSDVKPGDNKATNVAFRGIDNGRTYAEIRVIAGNLYLQGDVKGILALAHKSKLYAEVQARAATLPAFVKAFVAGQWVSINGAAAQGLASQFGGGGAQTTNPAQAQKLLADLKGVVDRDVTVTRAGTDSRGDHLVLKGNTRTLARDFVAAMQSSVPGGSVLGSQLNATNAPSRTITLDAWVKGGTLSELSLDLVQFAKPGEAPAGAHLPIALTFEQSGADITTPSGVTPVDLTQLGSLLGALGGA